MQVVVANNQQILWEGESERIFLPVSGGNIVVLEGHAPMVGLLDKGTVAVEIDDGRKKEIEIEGGIVWVKDNCVNLLLG